MPRDRVVLTREPDVAGRPEPTPDQQAEYNRIFRRGFIYVGIGALFDVAAAVLIVLENWAAGIAVAVVGILIGVLAAREFGRAGRTVEAMRERGY
jgi:Cyanobacterial TRADD-N associated 2-Transmembrane domain